MFNLRGTESWGKVDWFFLASQPTRIILEGEKKQENTEETHSDIKRTCKTVHRH